MKMGWLIIKENPYPIKKPANIINSVWWLLIWKHLLLYLLQYCLILSYFHNHFVVYLTTACGTNDLTTLFTFYYYMWVIHFIKYIYI